MSPASGVPATGAANSINTLLIVTCIDGALRVSGTGSCASARQSLVAATCRGIHVVLASYHSATEMMAVQHELGIVTPFIALHGGTLCIPAGYLPSPKPHRPQRGWDMMEITPPSIEDAIQALLARFDAAGQPPLVVGIGASWTDHALLRHVDIPILIRSALVDQGDLRRAFPGAYLTGAAGPDGWTEAILGPS
jgi:predicted mannosyl-3-phosphoglycerate phosphatase (HAD superfamily)